jgi:hypothetical protein
MQLHELSWVDWGEPDGTYKTGIRRIALPAPGILVAELVNGTFNVCMGTEPGRGGIDALTAQCLLYAHFRSGDDDAG